MTDALGHDTFPRLRRHVVWINCASRSPLPARTLAVGLSAIRKKAETPWDIGDTDGDKQEIRRLFAELLGEGASSKDIAFMPSCSYAISLAAANLISRIVAERKHVVVLEDQMHSNVMPWQHICTKAGGEIIRIKRPDDYDWTGAVVKALELGTVAICALPPCHWCDGSVVDLKRFAQYAASQPRDHWSWPRTSLCCGSFELY